ncbi:PadR family transcriptional regulator [Rhizocola hellebori]|uniref:PadR family transcriptional regulator n=1 Tax=Rhizocola hellebori TaxID=1392758 RepID=A0A8J3QAM9_9ACTN|nr:PadR family transcriptional regulator [Rhizocola hellebori]GIH06362.1 PadR family transcriptional regulator [Rhizocola hellebori]
MSTGHLLLGLLAHRPQHGYELKRAHDSRLPTAKPLPFGQVYATLGRLERDGLIEPAGSDRDGGPDRVSYRMTDAGRQALREWLDAVETPAAFLGGTMFTKIVVALVAADRQTAMRCLANQRAAHMVRMRELTQLKQRAASIAETAAADYSIAHLDADLRWMQQTMDRLDTLDQEMNS